MEVWRRGRDCGVSRHNHHHRAFFTIEQADRPYSDRCAAHSGRLFDERYDRDFRSDPRESPIARARDVPEYRQPQHQSDLEPDRTDIGFDFSHGAIPILVWRAGTKWLFFSARDWYYYRDLLVDFYREPDFGFLAQRSRW